MDMQINFPNLHIYLDHVGKSVEIFGVTIAYYGIVIAVGMVLGILLILRRARAAGENPDTFLDLCLYTVIFAVAGARLYYVVFSWDYYRQDPLAILNLREGGLAIYGGVLAGAAAVLILCRIKKLSFMKTADIVIPGLLVGQVIGRWGNFFNREVFGQYTNGLFAMELPLSAVRSMDDVTAEMLNHARVAGGETFVQVHPTFLYESLWNLALLCFLLWYGSRKKFDGELFLFYLFFYGLGRFWIESIRTDQLKLRYTGLPVSMVLAAVCMAVSAVLYLWMRRRKVKVDKN